MQWHVNTPIKKKNETTLQKVNIKGTDKYFKVTP